MIFVKTIELKTLIEKTLLSIFEIFSDPLVKL